VKKNELLHVHGLLAELAGEFIEEGRLAPEDLEDYESMGVTATSLRAPKEDHEAAVLELAARIAEAAEERPASVPADD